MSQAGEESRRGRTRWLRAIGSRPSVQSHRLDSRSILMQTYFLLFPVSCLLVFLKTRRFKKFRNRNHPRLILSIWNHIESSDFEESEHQKKRKIVKTFFYTTATSCDSRCLFQNFRVCCSYGSSVLSSCPDSKKIAWWHDGMMALSFWNVSKVSKIVEFAAVQSP